MAIVMIQQMPDMFSTDMYDAVNAKMEAANSDPPDGLIAHTLGKTDAGNWQVVDIWRSREDNDRFAEERLEPAMRAVAGEMGMDYDAMPEVEKTSYELHNLMEPAAAAH